MNGEQRTVEEAVREAENRFAKLVAQGNFSEAAGAKEKMDEARKALWFEELKAEAGGAS